MILFAVCNLLLWHADYLMMFVGGLRKTLAVGWIERARLGLTGEAVV